MPQRVDACSSERAMSLVRGVVGGEAAKPSRSNHEMATERYRSDTCCYFSVLGRPQSLNFLVQPPGNHRGPLRSKFEEAGTGPAPEKANEARSLEELNRVLTPNVLLSLFLGSAVVPSHLCKEYEEG